jgi:hypothetical protein
MLLIVLVYVVVGSRTCTLYNPRFVTSYSSLCTKHNTRITTAYGSNCNTFP